MESRIGGRLGHVRLHTGPTAHRSASELGAAAYTVGRHVVLGRAAGRLTGPARNMLLGHELAHSAQQRFVTDAELPAARAGRSGDRFESEANQVASSPQPIGVCLRTAGPVVQQFSEDELRKYLASISANGIEDNRNSDNKARAIVNRWKQGGSDFELTPRLMVLLIEEMLDGPTLDDDENAILEILERAGYVHLRHLFGGSGVSVERLLDDLHGEEDTRLRRFLTTRFEGGLGAIRSDDVQPVGRSVPFGAPLQRSEEDRRPGDELPAQQCDIRNPAACYSYESWIEQFLDLARFESRSARLVPGKDVPMVLGVRAPIDTANDPDALPPVRRPPRIHGRQPYTYEDGFIDGPTETWVRRHLPAHLVEVAYQLPSDCADIAVILRHVWLVYHHRSEDFQGRDTRVWSIGSQLGDPRSKHIQDLIVQTIYTGNVARIVRPYTSADGSAMRGWSDLESRLHVGDMLVWDHPAPAGGHAHTIMNITRDGDGNVTSLDVLQGNLPIGEGRATDIVEAEIEAGRIRQSRKKQSIKKFRRYPGRRIERNRLRPNPTSLRDVDGIWTWKRSKLVAAGPPVNADGPGSVNNAGGRRLEDWLPTFRAATSANQLQSLFEAAVLKLRTQLETGEDVGPAGAENFGRAAGLKLWELAAASASRTSSGRLSADDLGETSHYRPLKHMLGMLDAVSQRSRTTDTIELFDQIAIALEAAARGTTSVSFAADQARVLVTGFDPFSSGHQPERGRVNPAGAVALQLDGTELDGASGRRTGVEGVVLPVSFSQFRAGVVESLLDQQAGPLDAVITISLSPGRAPNAPLKLERFAVGVHELHDGTREGVPAGPSQAGTGPAIAEAQGADRIAERAGMTPSELIEDRTIRFEFTSAPNADAALEALGLAPEGSATVLIRDLEALRIIAAGAIRRRGGTGIRFRVGGRTHRAEILRGPGGDFLSNEVSYRMLRALQGESTTSFHLHTPRATADAGGVIPQEVSTRAQRSTRLGALRGARQVIAMVAESVRKIIKAVT